MAGLAADADRAAVRFGDAPDDGETETGAAWCSLVDGELATTTDVRAVFGGLLQDVVGIDAGDVIEAAPAPLTLV